MNRTGWMLAGGVAGAVGLRTYLARRAEMDIQGQVAVITGGSRGLGFLLAREFAHEGCRVVIAARDTAELDRARRDLESRGAQVLAVECDVADKEQADDLIRQAERRFGSVDILVNNAGVIQVGPVQTMAVEDFENAMGVMFWGVLYPTLAALPGMLDQKRGRIVNITSIGGKVSVPHLVPYACAKFAAVGLSEGLRAELKPEGLRVVTIVPGLMRTGSFLNAFFKGQQEKEFRWFSLGATLPGISMDAERAARQIVLATKRGRAEKILSTPARALALFHGLFPGLSADLLGIVNQLALPRAATESDQVRGMDVQQRAHSRVMRALTRMGQSAAVRFNEA